MKIPRIRDDEILSACRWAQADADDDFCPDYVRYADYSGVTNEHIRTLRMSCLRPDMHQLARLIIPRDAGILSRSTTWLPFPLRITYMLILRRLLPSLRTCVSPSCYSSRLENWDGEAYPWSLSNISAWARMRNDYRKLVIEHGSEGHAIETDITAFYEHITIVDFVEVLASVLREQAASFNDELEALGELLQAGTFKGRGLIQNMDPSRFFVDSYLRVVDDRVHAIPDISYFRFVDDIRVVARTRGAAVRGLQQLEAHLKANGLFLNSKKTLMIDAKTADWEKAKDASHDFRLAQCDELLNQTLEEPVREALRIAITEMRKAFERHDASLVRAYGNKIVRAARFKAVRRDACVELEAIALDGFRLYPGDAQRWAEFAAPGLSEKGSHELLGMLRTTAYNAHPWTNMWLIIAMARAESLSGDAMDTLRSTVNNVKEPDYLRRWAAVAFARHGDGLQRREVVDVCLADPNSMFLRRAAVIAAQELPSGAKSTVKAQTTGRDPVMCLLWNYLDEHFKYDWYMPQSREFRQADEKSEETPSFEAVGLVDGQPRRFRAYSRGSEYVTVQALAGSSRSA